MNLRMSASSPCRQQNTTIAAIVFYILRTICHIRDPCENDGGEKEEYCNQTMENLKILVNYSHGKIPDLLGS